MCRDQRWGAVPPSLDVSSSHRRCHRRRRQRSRSYPWLSFSLVWVSSIGVGTVAALPYRSLLDPLVKHGGRVLGSLLKASGLHERLRAPALIYFAVRGTVAQSCARARPAPGVWMGLGYR